MRLSRYFVKRLFQLIPVLLVIVALQFALVQAAPGDVAQIMAGENQDPAFIAGVRERLGLDRPVLEQFGIYLLNLVKGDFGQSATYGLPVLKVIGDRLGATILLLGISLLLASTMGTALGTWLSRQIGSRTDTTFSLLAIAAYSAPVFWIGLMLILVFGVWLKVLPTSGIVSGNLSGLPLAVDVARHLVLPVAALTTVYLGQYLRLSRTSVSDALREDYIQAARAAGHSERTVLFRFALRNALLPIVTVFGLHLGVVLAGAVLTETVFSWPGVGTLLYQAILARDIPLVTGTYVIVGATVLVAALLTDLCYAWLDPRVEY